MNDITPVVEDEITITKPVKFSKLRLTIKDKPQYDLYLQHLGMEGYDAAKFFLVLQLLIVIAIPIVGALKVNQALPNVCCHSTSMMTYVLLGVFAAIPSICVVAVLLLQRYKRALLI